MASTPLTWGNIKTMVALNLGKMTDSVIDTNVATLLPLWATGIQTKILNDRNYWFLRQSGTIPLAAGVQSYPLPPGYSEGVTLYLIFTSPVKAYVELKPLYTRQEVVRIFAPVVSSSDYAQPTHHLVQNTQFELWPCPDQAYSLGADYWGNMDYPSTDDSFSNYLMQFFPDLYTAMLTKKGFEYLQEFEDAAYMEKQVQMELANLRARHVARVLGSDFSFRPRTDVYGDFFTNRGNQWVTYLWGS